MDKIGALNPRRLATSLLAALGAAGAAAGQTPPPAVPVEPITAILVAFERHAIVALGDPHDNEQAHEFRLALIRDPRFAETVDDIVVEWGNALYQDVMDRFVGGDDVSEAELRQVWQNTTQAGLGNDRPITEAFFRAVREVNAALSPERRLRVLLGDPPIDWDAVETRTDHRKWLELRDTYPASLIRREVLDKGPQARTGRLRRHAPAAAEPVLQLRARRRPEPPHARPAARARGRRARVRRLADGGGRPAGASRGTRRRGPRPASRRCEAPCSGRRTSRCSPRRTRPARRCGTAASCRFRATSGARCPPRSSSTPCSISGRRPA